ncbi:MAG: hypothetical protein ABGW81_10950 [Paracoccaceae bacterium]
MAIRCCRQFLSLSRLHYWVLAGLGLMGSGIIWGGIITGGWIASDYGPLNEIRNLSAAVTLIIIGDQVFFVDFLLSIVSGNTTNHSLNR